MATESIFDVLIVGAGHGGAQTAIALRQRGFEGTIGVIGEENEHPYERPPLSKDYLSGEKRFDRMLTRPVSFWHERNVEIITNERVVHIDPRARLASTATGRCYEYRSLVWSGGGRARRLSCDGSTLSGIHSVRTRHDVDTLRADLAAATRVCVIGGGYIGLESAAVLRKLGKRVTVLEAQDRLLARVSGVTISKYLEFRHRNEGVDILLNASVRAFHGFHGRVKSVELDGGNRIDCDVVIVGVGIAPATEPLLNAGCGGSDGVDVDEFCRTSLPEIYAVGDCARHKNRFANTNAIRLESVQNANDMANTVAKHLTGSPEPYTSVPWFWSNQYDLRLQTMGIAAGFDQEVIRGAVDRESLTVVYLQDGVVRAADCVNATKDYVGVRRLIEAKARVPLAILADENIPLKSLAPSSN